MKKTIGHTYSLENGSYSTVIEKTDYKQYIIVISLGYSPKKIKTIDSNKTLLLKM
jgi:hypothetical protein